jgi:hypothetical protein
MKRMCKHSNTGTERRAKAASTGKIVFQLDKICKDLQLTPEQLQDTNDESAILDAVIESLRDRANNSMPVCTSSSDTILHNQDKNSLTPAQIHLVGQINKAMTAVIIFVCPLRSSVRSSIATQDFLLRRQMLMKRCDVTIQTFLWAGNIPCRVLLLVYHRRFII